MVVRIGRPESPKDFVDLLLDCHQRIREFSDMAVRLGETEVAPEDQVVDAAAKVRRYFSEALPLHAADEDESLLPRLRGLDRRVDEALERMSAEHREHEPMLADLVRRVTELEEFPARHPEVRAELLRSARTLQRELERHLVQEEQDILPVVRERLAPDVHAEMIAELRARRGT